MADSSYYAARLAAWERECERQQLRQEGYQAHTSDMYGAATNAQVRYPLPPRPEPPKVPRVVTAIDGASYRVFEGILQYQRPSTGEWCKDAHSPAWYYQLAEQIASLITRPYEGDPEPELTPEWVKQWAKQRHVDVIRCHGDALDFAFAVLATFGGTPR